MTAPPAPARPAAGVRLEVRDARVRLGRAQVLDGVGVAVEPGSWLCVVGPNGAGKSTLLRALAGLVGYQGEVLIDGRQVAGLPARQRARLVGYAPQTPVVPQGASVFGYVMLGRTPYQALLGRPGRGDRSVVVEVIERLDLAGLAGRQLSTLSGGERQRAVLARALAQQPRVLLLDEPTAALDLGHAQQVLELVDRLRAESGLTVVSTLHDLALAGQYADRLLLLSGGVVAGCGPAEQVLTEQTLAQHYGARAEVTSGPDGVRVHPVRPQ